MHAIHEDLRHEVHRPLAYLVQGKAHVDHEDGLCFVVEKVEADAYHNAQIYDYGGLARQDYPDKPPLRMTVRACFSHTADQLKGTAGFGFWNQPTQPGQFGFRLPRYIWFFLGSKPNNMAFAKGVPGYGWKAATLDASRLPALLLAPTLPVTFLLMRIRTLYRRLWPMAQWAIGAAEAMIDVDIRALHTYQLDWLKDKARFFVDGRLILETRRSPRGPLGFVAWMDNSCAVFTPQGSISLGQTTVPERQWLKLQHLSLEPL